MPRVAPDRPLRPVFCRRGRPAAIRVPAAVLILLGGCWIGRGLAADAPRLERPQAAAFVQTGTLAAAEAHQAAAADEQFVWAIASRSIAKYDRATGQRLAVSRGEAEHLNSGFFWQNRLYCAHSNYPKRPEHSEIKVLDPETMQLSTFKSFGASEGSLTWAVRHEDHWWCTFAYYGADNPQTYLARFDDQWREQGRWRYPPEVVQRMGRNSISGGLWCNGTLLVTGHDAREVYRLQLPADGEVLEYIQTLAAPFTGQGIAADPATGGLVGIDRARRLIVFARFERP